QDQTLILEFVTHFYTSELTSQMFLQLFPTDPTHLVCLKLCSVFKDLLRHHRQLTAATTLKILTAIIFTVKNYF
ncbi:hypothetical protein, partial [Ligilactobacillus agilis]|uniref:hypothetical protein n=1 Tax=Ligilactobacillus agilis TaxID=1601 RepID=UPI001CDD3F5A